jgi:uncharacterized membrane protein YhaH (DUF805 family)
MSEGQANPKEHQIKACETFVEQTKLLMTLASGFLFGPAGAAVLFKKTHDTSLNGTQIWLFLVSEVLFVLSVLAGYLTMGSITGSMAKGDFDVYRPAVMRFGLLQFVAYFAGLVLFIAMAVSLTS